MTNKLRKLYLGLILLFMYAPIVILMVLSFNASKSRAKWGGFTLKWYKELFANEEMLGALYTTILIALIASLIAVIVGVIASIVINNLKSKSRKLVMGVTNIPMLNADIVTGISLMIFFIVCRFTLGFSTVLIAHITFSIPYVILSVLPRLSRLDSSLIEAAQDLGSTKKRAFFKILIPEIYPGIISGFLLSFTMSVDDFIITHFTKGPGINTLSTKIYTELRKGIKPEMYSLSTLLFITVLFLMIFTQKSDFGYKNTNIRKFVSFIQTKVIPLVVLVAVVFCSIKVYRYNHPTSKERVVVYNWGEYIDPDVIKSFEKETGIEVIYEEYESNETMYAKVKNGAVSYDVLCPSDYMIQKMINEDMLLELDYTKIPNIKNVGKSYILKSQSFDKDNKYSVPYLWGTLGIIYNTEMVDDEVNSWNILWNDKYKDNILMYDSVRDSMCVSLGLAGYSINSRDLDELEEAKNLLIEQKPLVSGYVTDQCKDKMVGEEDALCVMYSGDAIFAIRENDKLNYVVPKENSNMWIDSLVVPKNSVNTENAFKFIDYLCREDIALKNYEYTGYSSPVSYVKNNLSYEDKKYIDIIFPDDNVLSRLEVYCDLGKDWTNKYSEIFKEIKSK